MVIRSFRYSVILWFLDFCHSVILPFLQPFISFNHSFIFSIHSLFFFVPFAIHSLCKSSAPSIGPTIEPYLSLQPYIPQSIQLFIRLAITFILLPFIQPWPSIHFAIHSSFHSFSHSSVHLFVHSAIFPFIHSLRPLFILFDAFVMPFIAPPILTQILGDCWCSAFTVSFLLCPINTFNYHLAFHNVSPVFAYAASILGPNMLAYDEAMAAENCTKWIEAAAQEIAQLESKGTWIEVPIAEARTRILPGTWMFRLKRRSVTWVFGLKRTPDGSILKFMARYYVRGDLQEDEDLYLCCCMEYSLIVSCSITCDGMDDMLN